MPWYNILRSQDNKISDFMVGEDDIPIEYETEEEAFDAKRGHVAEAYIDTIEID